MNLSAGIRLGAYEVVAPLGAGGMGEVYRAHDAKLGRDVALKVLPEAFARDGERVARFQREAKVLASLNHPNIASIYGLEDSGPTHALVMELVIWNDQAKVQLRAIDQPTALRILHALARYLETGEGDVKRLQDIEPPEFRLRVGDYRVRFHDHGDTIRITKLFCFTS